MCPLQLTMLLSQVILVASCVFPAIPVTLTLRILAHNQSFGEITGEREQKAFLRQLIVAAHQFYCYRWTPSPSKEWSLNLCICWSHIATLLQIKSSPGALPQGVAGYCLSRTCFSPDAWFLQQFYSAKAFCEMKGAGRVGSSRNHHFGKACNFWSEKD